MICEDAGDRRTSLRLKSERARLTRDGHREGVRLTEGGVTSDDVHKAFPAGNPAGFLLFLCLLDLS
jgi:hypothetical protein